MSNPKSVMANRPADHEAALQSSSDLQEIEQRLEQTSALLASEASPQSLERPQNKPVDSSKPVELSIVIPCLDEADTLGICIEKAKTSIERLGIEGEVVVADNGSQDDSVAIAKRLGARVVHVQEPGYGAALMGGIEAAYGKYVIMGDADDSYDFSQAHRFYEVLRDTDADLVQGCRLPRGGGTVMPGAMPWLHQYGNPALTSLVRTMFKAPIHDVYCGMRGFKKEHYTRLDQRCTGMEFATEMIIKSTLFGADIREIPITLHPDGRKAHRPHLRTFRDGWRTLRFFLLLSPRWTFLVPSMILGLVGLVGCILVLGRISIGNAVFDAHTLLVAVLALLLSAQLASFAVVSKCFAATEGLLPRHHGLEKALKVFSLERCLTTAVGMVVGGVSVLAWKSWGWAASGFGGLDYSETMRWIIPAAGAIALGFQVAFSSFMLSVIRMGRR